MKRTSLVAATKVVFLFSSLSALASSESWTEITKNRFGNTVYVRGNDVQMRNGYRRLWIMLDYHSEPVDGARSSILLTEIDCSEARYRWLSGAAYSGLRGSGDQLRNSKGTSDWTFAAPDTVSETIVDYACKAPVRNSK